jgi:hypothetical protein
MRFALMLALVLSGCRGEQPSSAVASPKASVAAASQSTASQTGVSQSLVLRSTHILRIKLLTVASGPWAPSRPGFKARTVDLTVEVAETLRGKLDSATAGPVHVSITQSDYASELMWQPLPGPWPGGDLAPGASLVVFAQSKDARVERLLVEPACTQVGPAEPVLTGLRIAAQAEAGNLPLARTLALAARETARLDPTFADFVWGKYGGPAMGSPAFDLLAEFAERKGLDARTRQALLSGASDAVGFYGDSTPARAQRLALAMCRVLLMDEAADLRENLIGTFLPNLLGITSALPRQPASAVFKGHDVERRALSDFLNRHGTGADAKPLQTWLNAR